MAIEIVSFPIKHGDIPYVWYAYQRVNRFKGESVGEHFQGKSIYKPYKYYSSNFLGAIFLDGDEQWIYHILATQHYSI